MTSGSGCEEPVDTEKPFICPKCGYHDAIFHAICPECGRPFMRDYIDTQVYPRDPDLTGVCTSKFWIRVFLLFTLGGIIISLLFSFGILR
jgi:hypothetical protein